MLSNAAVKAARPRSRAYKMFDERGLHLFVAPTGLRAWRLKYRFEGREKLLSIGRWPELQLVEARARADEARDLIAQGADPAIAAKKPTAIVTFEGVARDWHALQREHWTDRHAEDVLDSLARDIFPEFGPEPIDGVSSPMVLRALRLVEARGAVETARRLRQRISAVFAFGISEGLADKDPAAIVEKALKPKGREGRQPALLELDQAQQLLAAAERAGGPPIIRLASRFLALTAVRMPYADFIRRYDRAGMLFYLDPPYWNCETDYGAGVFDRADFDRLAAQLATIAGKFIVSINDTPGVRAAFSAFHMQEVETTYSISAGAAGKAKRVGELIITNFPLDDASRAGLGAEGRS